MTRRLVLYGAVLGLCLGPGVLWAQGPGQVIKPGDRIRVYRVAEPGGAVTGKFVARDETALQVATDSAGPPLRIPLAEVSRLERSSGKHGHTLLGLGVGGVVGLGLGVAGAATTGGANDLVQVGTGEVALVTAVFAGAGALLGTVIRSDSWTEVPLSALEPTPLVPDSTGPIAPAR
jgi:hypothetical protein